MIENPIIEHKICISVLYAVPNIMGTHLQWCLSLFHWLYDHMLTWWYVDMGVFWYADILTSWDIDIIICWCVDMLTRLYACKVICQHASVLICCVVAVSICCYVGTCWYADMFVYWYVDILTCSHVDALTCWYVDNIKTATNNAETSVLKRCIHRNILLHWYIDIINTVSMMTMMVLMMLMHRWGAQHIWVNSASKSRWLPAAVRQVYFDLAWSCVLIALLRISGENRESSFSCNNKQTLPMSWTVLNLSSVRICCNKTVCLHTHGPSGQAQQHNEHVEQVESIGAVVPVESSTHWFLPLVS
jgi:hypothetical protein